MNIIQIIGLAFFFIPYNPNSAIHISQSNQKLVILPKNQISLSQRPIMQNLDNTNDLKVIQGKVTPEFISTIVTAVGVIVTAVGVIIAASSLSWQIKKSEKDKQNAQIAAIRSSLIDMKGRLFNLYNSTFEDESTLEAICFEVSEKIRSCLSNLNQKEILESLENQKKVEFIKSAVGAHLRKSNIRTELLKELNDIRTISTRYESDMPLITGIISDCLLIISWDIMSFTSVSTFPLLSVEKPLNKEFCEHLKNLEELNNDNISNVSLIFEEITMRLIKDAKKEKANQLLPMAWATIIITNLRNLIVKGYQKLED